jgi:hypothetical protein
MKIYFVNTRPEDAERSGIKRLLLSYGLMRSMKSNLKRFLEVPDKYEIFLDSGAFQVLSLGSEVTLEEYAAFINEYGFKLYANLDVIGDAQRTLENQEKMEDMGLEPVPVFHIGEDVSFLDYYLDRYSYIALGGIVKRGSQVYNRNFLKRCFWRIKEHWPIKIHGFGVTDQTAMETFPFYSTDSASAVVSAAFGRIIEFRRRKLSFGRQRQIETGSRHPHLVDNLVLSGSRGRDRTVHNLLVYLEFEEYITKLWEKKGIKWE